MIEWEHECDDCPVLHYRWAITLFHDWTVLRPTKSDKQLLKDRINYQQSRLTQKTIHIWCKIFIQNDIKERPERLEPSPQPDEYVIIRENWRDFMEQLTRFVSYYKMDAQVCYQSVCH